MCLQEGQGGGIWPIGPRVPGTHANSRNGSAQQQAPPRPLPPDVSSQVSMRASRRCTCSGGTARCVSADGEGVMGRYWSKGTDFQL